MPRLARLDAPGMLHHVSGSEEKRGQAESADENRHGVGGEFWMLKVDGNKSSTGKG